MITRISGVIRPKGSDLIFDHPYNAEYLLSFGLRPLRRAEHIAASSAASVSGHVEPTLGRLDRRRACSSAGFRRGPGRTGSTGTLAPGAGPPDRDVLPGGRGHAGAGRAGNPLRYGPRLTAEAPAVISAAGVVIRAPCCGERREDSGTCPAARDAA